MGIGMIPPRQGGHDAISAATRTTAMTDAQHSQATGHGSGPTQGGTAGAR